tara:strand:+ start:132 stop:299 length:168 start_codon:yes stop_codon:yes gene_type:complete
MAGVAIDAVLEAGDYSWPPGCSSAVSMIVPLSERYGEHGWENSATESTFPRLQLG